MNQEAASTYDTTSSPPSQQEPVVRRLRRSYEDGQAATLREARGRGGPLEIPSRPLPSPLLAKRKWRRRVDDAGARWSLLTEDDLQKLEDHERTLAELIQERYGLHRTEADRQVMHFIEDHLSSTL